MRITEIFRLVYLNLSQNKFKVILTSIGIVVGTATIMMVIAIGTGGKLDVAEQFKNLNAGAIDISYESTSSSATSSEGSGGFPGGGGGFPGGGMPSGTRSSGSGFPGGGFPGGGFPGGGADERINQEDVSLTESDMDDLLVFVPGLSDATISFTTKADCDGGELDETTNYTIAGVKDNYATLSNMTLSIGKFMTEENETNKEKVCVLGYNTALEIFGSAYDAYDGTVYIDDRPYTVSGVLDEMGTVAYATGVKYLTGDDVSPTITLIAEDVNHVDTLKTYVTDVLLDSYPNSEFTITDAGSKMEAAMASNDTLTMLLVAMAVIVFIVGGIGIMNVLFVSVKERTNEIGILKALGCKQEDILKEFVFEASCISLIGAIMGVLIALGITPIIEKLSVRVELSVSGAIISLLFGVLTGTIFGFYPAYKASKLIPIVALNQE